MSEYEKIDINNISHKLHNWGPCLMGTTVPKEITSYLLEKGRTLELDAKRTLAGHLETELFFEQEHKLWFIDKTKNIFAKHIDVIKNEWSHNNAANFDTVELDKFWINFMKPGEFNPMHTHSGQISFVLFCKVDDEIKKEHKNYSGNHSGPGTLEFHYGQPMRNEIGLITRYELFPEVGDMFIFPAYLSHMVCPFQTPNTERVSVSGNIFLK